MGRHLRIVGFAVSLAGAALVARAAQGDLDFRTQSGQIAMARCADAWVADADQLLELELALNEATTAVSAYAVETTLAHDDALTALTAAIARESALAAEEAFLLTHPPEDRFTMASLEPARQKHAAVETKLREFLGLLQRRSALRAAIAAKQGEDPDAPAQGVGFNLGRQGGDATADVMRARGQPLWKLQADLQAVEGAIAAFHTTLGGVLATAPGPAVDPASEDALSGAITTEMSYWLNEMKRVEGAAGAEHAAKLAAVRGDLALLRDTLKDLRLAVADTRREARAARAMLNALSAVDVIVRGCIISRREELNAAPPAVVSEPPRLDTTRTADGDAPAGWIEGQIEMSCKGGRLLTGTFHLGRTGATSEGYLASTLKYWLSDGRAGTVDGEFVPSDVTGKAAAGGITPGGDANWLGVTSYSGDTLIDVQGALGLGAIGAPDACCGLLWAPAGAKPEFPPGLGCPNE